MNRTIWTLPLLAVVAACSGNAANNVVAANVAAPANVAGPAAPPANSTASTAGEQAMPPGLDCVRNRLTPEERRGVAAAASEQASRDDPRAQALLQAVDACATELSWSPEKKRIAGMFSMSAAGVSALQEELTGQGLQLAELDQAIESDTVFMAAANAGELGGAAGQEFAQRHAALIERILGDRTSDQRLGTRLGNYIAFRAIAIATANRFSQEP